MTDAERSARYRAKHPERRKETQRRYREAVPGRSAEQNQRWRAANPDKVRAMRSAYARTEYKNTGVSVAFVYALRLRITRAQARIAKDDD